jgi:hypothetical protein
MISINRTWFPLSSAARIVSLHCAVAALLVLLTAAATAPAQTADEPTIRRDATVELKHADATSVPKTLRPLTPSDKLRAPFPPEKPGCFHLVDNVWKEAHCATAEEIKAHHTPPPVLANSIQSTAHNGPFIIGKFPGPFHFETITSPFEWGSVAVNQTSDPATATEVDQSWGANAFSIQTNTNFFTCSPCKAGSPFAAVPGIPNSASEPGDTGWVQFVYQQFKTGSAAGKGSSDLCVWNVDVTVAYNTSNNAGYSPTCVYPSESEAVAPLDGTGAAIGGAEVIGYVQCPTAGSDAGCTLWLVAQLPWSPGSGWWSISAPDSMGLAGSWTNVSGAMIGAGGGSEAVFTKTQMQQEVRAYSCYASPTSATGYAPTACPNPSPYNFFARYFELTASPAESYVTGESSNLTNDPVTISCGDYDCWMWYNSTAP